MSEENQSNVPALFSEPGPMSTMASDAAAVARATQEVQAALVIAKRFPRDEVKAIAKITAACQRKELAAEAEYEYSRGGTKITGPTIDLLRAIANRWGNVEFGWTEVERRDGQSLVRCSAWDMESNGKAFRSFIVKHWRDTQSGGYPLTDERDIYELLANMSARRVRACLEEVIDADVVTKAIDVCRETLRKGHTTPLRDRVAKMLVEFNALGVTQTMIETRLGNKLDSVSENQLASLRRVWKALQDGVGRREDYFKPEMAKPDLGDGEPPKAPEAPQEPSKRTRKGSTPAPEPETSPSGQDGGKATPQSGSPESDFEPQKPEKPVTSGFNAVRAVRNLCKMASVGEGAVLDYLSGMGATDGSCTTLEEVALQNNDVLKLVAEQWTDVIARIKAAKK